MTETPTDQPTASDAAQALRRQQEIDQAVRTQSGWYRRYLLIAAAASFIGALLSGLGGFRNHAILGAVPFFAFLVGTLVLDNWARKQPVRRAGFRRRDWTTRAAWTLVWIAVVAPGQMWHDGDPSWWVPGALATALPCLIAYWWEGRHA